MINIYLTEEFICRFNELSQIIKNKAKKQEEFFKINPFYPSLNVEKLNPKNLNLWSFRVDKDYRIIFKFLENNNVIFLTISHHNWIYKF